jgi:hypothetical protein
MAARSTHVTLTNLAGRLNLRKTSEELDHGEWTSHPPALVGNRADWESESDGFATGTEGRVAYEIENDTGGAVGTLNLHWDNPFVGSNSYDESVSPQADVTGNGFTVVHRGGGGNNADVEFVLLSGRCEVNPDNGEISCSVFQPDTASATQRYAAIWQKDGGPTFHARHGLTADQYQQTFDELVGLGFRPTVVDGYEVGGEDRFAAVFELRPGPAFQARHGLTSDQYQQFFDEMTGQGFRPTDVSGYELNGEARYAAVFEQNDGRGFAARHGLTADQYQQAFDELTGQGFRPTDVSGFGVNGEAHYAAIFEQNDGRGFAGRHGLTADQYQQAFDELTAQGLLPSSVSGFNIGGEDSYAAIFDQRDGPPFVARHGLSADQYQATFDEMIAQGFRLTEVSGYSVG